MGWNISHGTNHNNQIRRSYTSISNLAQHLANTLSGREWRAMAPVFTRRDGNPFAVPAAEAGRTAALLRKAAGHRKMPPDRGGLAQELADAAQKAANARQPWEWS